MNIKRSIKQAVKAAIPETLLFRLRVRRSLANEKDLRAVLALGNGRIFLDVGANEGTWAGAAAASFREVHAFEPIAALATKVAKLIPPNVTVHNVALSDHKGNATLFVPRIDGLATTSRASLEAQANGAAEAVLQDVELRTLDSYEFTGVDVIKIDVEGHEAATLRGTEHTLERERPALVIEIEERHHEGESEAIVAWVCERDYDCFYFAKDGLRSFRTGEIAQLQPHRNTAVGARFDDYVNNFIFLPKERCELLSRLQ
jgi:FkbM family methyltransferase